MRDVSDKYKGMSADCLKEAGFEKKWFTFADLDIYKRDKDYVFVEKNKIYWLFLD